MFTVAELKSLFVGKNGLTKTDPEPQPEPVIETKPQPVPTVKLPETEKWQQSVAAAILALEYAQECLNQADCDGAPDSVFDALDAAYRNVQHSEHILGRFV